MAAAVYDNVSGIYSLPRFFDNSSGFFLLQTFTNSRGYVVELLDPGSQRCDSWILLPAENLWPAGGRAALYIFALLWMFLGVAIVADIFVGAIEVITSQKKQVTTFDPERQEMVVRDVLIWNETVANLTLLAMGSSMPEILLATIEQVSNLSLDQSNVQDDLGTFTIVGSAAFNLLLITAVCVISVPSPKVLTIEEYGVFIVTACWSLFAYLWLIITLLWVSPGEIYAWEACVTLLFFPLLVCHAWAQSKGWWLDKVKRNRVRIVGVNLPRAGDTRAVALEDVEETLHTIEMQGHNDTIVDMSGSQEDCCLRGGEDTSFTSDRGTSTKETDTDIILKTSTGSQPSMAVLNSLQRGSVVRASFHEAMSPGHALPLPANSHQPESDVATPPTRSRTAPAILVTQPSNSSDAGAASPTTSLSPSQQQAVRKTLGKMGVRLVSRKAVPACSPQDNVSLGQRRGSMTEASAVFVGEEEASTVTRAKFRRAAMRSLVGGFFQSPRNNQTVDRVAQAVRSAQHWHGLVKKRAGSEGAAVGDDGKDVHYVFFRDNNCVAIKSMGIVYLTVDLLSPRQCQRGTTSSEDGAQQFRAAVNFRGTSSSPECLVPHVQSDSAIIDVPAVEPWQVVKVHWETRDGSARAGKAYLKDGGVVTFQPGETSKRISISIATDDNYEEDEEFFVVLYKVEGGALAEPSLAKVKIVDDDQPGVFSFDCPRYFVHGDEAQIKCTVVREHGSDGTVEVKYLTLDGLGRGGRDAEGENDFAAQAALLVFQSRETSKEIIIPINPNSVAKQKNFVVSLKSISKGALLGEQSAAICILGDDDDPIATRVAKFISSADEEEISWRSQFETALTLGRQYNEKGEPEPFSNTVLVLHFFSMFWKVLFSFIPPRHLLNGWPCFLVSLFFIGGMTAVVEQIATLLGCAVNLRISVTGITLIALGTSLPDTFASRAAALQDKHADAAIGNITGSNSVNVFLGLGLPWAISSIYHEANGSVYRVSNRNLPFSVTVFISVAVCCLCILTFRRWYFGGELGGPKTAKWVTTIALVLLWTLYIALASAKAYGNIEGF